MFQPAVLHPGPDPLFVRELRKIDTNLRVVWGYERYLRQNWVIERRLDSDRYYKLYGSLFRENLPRFVAQPVYDSNQPLYDEAGELIGYRQVGERQYDLAPEWEWVRFVEEPDGTKRDLDSRTLHAIRREYAWNRFHSITRTKIEKQQEEDRQKEERRKKRQELIEECVDEAWHEYGKIVTGGQPDKVLKGTDY